MIQSDRRGVRNAEQKAKSTRIDFLLDDDGED